MRNQLRRRGAVVRALLITATAVLGVTIARIAPARHGTPIQAPPPLFKVIQAPADARLLGLESLRLAVQKDGGVPLPPDLDLYVRDRQAAIQLGKALFWDMQVGSDGIQSCATCHFNAGADARTKNQLDPALARVKHEVDGLIKGLGDAPGAPDKTFQRAGPNHQLSRHDFPFIRFPDEWVTNADGSIGPALGNTNDIISSAGVFLSLSNGIQSGNRVDAGSAQLDDIFNVGGVTVRRVEPRQAPTVINAVFNFHSFWDGRANNVFNGQNPFGNQDLGASILVVENGVLTQVKARLRNASLASQSVGPPLSFFEMSFGNGADNFRTWPEVGRKLLSLQPLAGQRVDPTDSVLGPLARGVRKGLNPKNFVDDTGAPINGYRFLIQKAFRPEYWSSTELVTMPSPGVISLPGPGPVDSTVPTFSQIEANTAFFFGVSVMLYESTLVSDDSPFDRWMAGSGKPVPGFGIRELRGLNVFANQGKCINCHGGPEFTNASVRHAQEGKNMIEPMLLAEGAAIYDNGFYNIGVTLTTDDIGRGGKDPFGLPLAHSRQVLLKRLGLQEIPFEIFGDPFPVRDENNQVVAGVDTDGSGFVEPGEEILIQRVAVDGAFKTPTLRNVELTGPYFHNGGIATLRGVVGFYNRGGDFPGFNHDNLDPDITLLELTEDQQRDLVSFLISLTDHRVRIQSAPFDHPELLVPQGSRGSNIHVNTSHTVNGIPQGRDSMLHIAAVGRKGGRPLRTFLGLSPHLRLFEPQPSPLARPPEVEPFPEFPVTAHALP